jgi:release factor glutamine methyltransferase
MKTVLKHIVSRTYKPLLVKYLSKTRIYRYGQLRLEIPPQVFHPGFFFSTQLLLQYISRLNVKGKNVLELGAGSGLISMEMANGGATVTASDINPVAVEYLHKNSGQNGTDIRIVLSDLFENIPAQQFDIIAINPPYYKKQPKSPLDHAWYCGENGEYFTRLFKQLPAYMHQHSEVLMILCDACDMELIRDAAASNGLGLSLVLTKENLLEKNFIYQIKHGNEK